MELRSDLATPQFLNFQNEGWVSSPVKGVDRLMLDRKGDEIARATTIVRFQDGLTFPQHCHGGGEELLVLSGSFSDSLTGSAYAGTYVRHPIGSSHAPWANSDTITGEPCHILVKLHFMSDIHETQSLVIDSEKMNTMKVPTENPGIETCLLYENDTTKERVWVEWWNGTMSNLPTKSSYGIGEYFEKRSTGGIEILILEGELMIDSKVYGKWSWIRVPSQWLTENIHTVLSTTDKGSKFWVKTGHLP
ncbi:hypothetical protein K7432_014079 [Basidiobolus ranarum]|uniref:ChrR-like cupin domain-containing protein n=1 Tax=Basidiobolus ranarum TaxID=34480 RepID=A0ABR2WI54_9FUNG